MSTETARLLIVDDDDDLRGLITLELQKAGYRVHSLPDATEAKAWLSTNKPHLIMLDVMMPNGNGLDLCRWIRARPELAAVPIIISSGIKDDETVEYALELGAMEFLRKPVEMAKLKKSIARWLKKAGDDKSRPDL